MRPSRRICIPTSGPAWLVPALAAIFVSALLAAGNVPSTPPTASDHWALIDKNCVMCHNAALQSGGISLATINRSDVAGSSEILEKVLHKLRSGEMPPPGMPRPDPPAEAAFTHWLADQLDEAAAAHPNPGRPTIHRLNRAEYSNAVRDLLGLDIQPGEMLPQDNTGYGFDNIGDVLSLSPMLIERYMSVARRISRLAVGDTEIKPEVAEFRAPKGHRAKGWRADRVADDLPFDSAGGMSIRYRFPVDATYAIKINLAPTGGFDGPQVGRSFELRLPVKAGTRTVAVTFPRDDSVPETIALPVSWPEPHSADGGGLTFADLRMDDARVKTFDLASDAGAPVLFSLVISGPYDVTGAGNTPSRRRIFACEPASATDEAPCARDILSGLARHAFRRPVSEADIQPLMRFYEEGRGEGSFDQGVEAAIDALLVSPDFLFRMESDPAGLPLDTAYRVNDVELASRLSFFLWSSIPDDELLRLAEQGRLHDPGVLSKQVDRMLADRKSKALIDNFAGQWLYLRDLAQVRPDPDEFPDFDAGLRRGFARETELFFSDILRSDKPITALLDARYTYVNQQLAEYYGIPGVYGPQFRRVALTDPDRGGILGQASILTVTSYPNRTSVVQRGKWVLENLLGSPPPPPPPNVPALNGHGSDGKQLTMREAMEQHRANPTCAACHARMDPIGFALENYNGIGEWRTKDAGKTIDASGKLPDGTEFEGLAGLRTLLLTKRRDDYVATVTAKLLTYALGRGLESYDNPAVRSIVREAGAENPDAPAPSFHALIHAIVDSVPFQMRRTPQT